MTLELYTQSLQPVDQVANTLQALRLKVESFAEQAAEALRQAGARGSRVIYVRREIPQLGWRKWVVSSTKSVTEKGYGWSLNHAVRHCSLDCSLYLLADGSLARHEVTYQGLEMTAAKAQTVGGAPIVASYPVGKLPDIASCENLASAIRNTAESGGALNEKLRLLYGEITGK